ncbi:MAG: GIN domain-containing protein [Muribaculaceae bacterium]
MKHLILSILALLIGCVSASATAKYTLSVGTFDELYVKGACVVDLRYRTDSIGTMVVETTSEVYESMEKALLQRSLYISMPQNTSRTPTHITIYCNRNLQVVSVAERCKLRMASNLHLDYTLSLIATSFATITADGLTATDLSISNTGGGKISLHGLVKAGNVTVSAVGSGAVTFHNLSANDLSTTLRGSGLVKIAGTATNQPALVVKGTGTIDVTNLQASRIQAAVYGEGFIYISSNSAIDRQGATDHITLPPNKSDK